MPRDLYATVAQVLPVLLLALVFESRHLERLRSRPRRLRRDDPANGVRFWTKGRVRVYLLSVAVVVLGDLGLCVLMLAGGVPDSLPLRVVAVAGVLLVLVTLLFRITVDVLDATRD
ncbi:hypothetical protein GCM10022403_035700 [Streptomyces coacervatus]|uniref:Uncharacterized protein n=1 Tax=Streptomyces coacervatus TaxID=647381 RepID=A0ABP7HLI6_9ACTN|nr:hypothetical protein [Streptomyces coacervatus]MDF2271000.1 hypothetical protein [Streptomyces coacervatus]